VARAVAEAMTTAVMVTVSLVVVLVAAGRAVVKAAKATAKVAAEVEVVVLQDMAVASPEAAVRVMASQASAAEVVMEETEVAAAVPQRCGPCAG